MQLPGPSEFRDLVSGRRRGLGAWAARCALRAAEVPYTLAVRYRNRRFDRVPGAVVEVEVPVVSVGNLTLGGTGKTPLVRWIAQWFRRRGVRVAVVSRGYGAEDGSRNDEARELEEHLPDVPHLQNPDRVAAARVAIEELQMQLLVLDDAFQHRRIGRDLDVVLLDALEPFGFEHVFPRGTLREPAAALRRADVVALSRADMLRPPQREAIRRRALGYAPEALWCEIVHAPETLRGADGRVEPIESLAGRKVAAFCGIGNPAGFRHTLNQCRFRVAALREFPDHHPYHRDDVDSLTSWLAGLDVDAVLCTHKDLVKLQVSRLGGRPLWAVGIGVDFLGGREALETRLSTLPIPPD
jgi:tetraacyldisaccharide 4'-kinase